MATERVAGILGGLGPEATVDFMSKVVAATDASCDQEHIHMLVDHNPSVPNRHAAIAGEAPSVAPQLVAMSQRLERAGADFLVMVCNTAHAYSADIRAAISIPFISIIDVSIEALGPQTGQCIGVMAAEGCLRAGLYQDALLAAGHEAITWNDAELEQFMDLVYRVKAGERDNDIGTGMRKLAASLEFSGAELLLAGCTEIPLFLQSSDISVPLLASTDLLVHRTIALARGQMELH
ncbi:MAG: amino acid racemase [Halieaceae bacterium]